MSESFEPSVAQLRALVALAEHSTVARAAVEEAQERTSLFRLVQRLARGLDLALYERGAPTSAAQELAGDAESIVQLVEKFCRTARELQEGRRALIRVGAYPAHVARLVAPCMAALRTISPLLRIELDVDDAHRDTAETLFNGLARRELDAIVAPFSALHHVVEDVDATELYAWRLVAVFPPKDAPRGPEPVQIEKLAFRPIAVSPTGHRSRALFDAAAADLHMSVEFACQSSSTEVLLALSDAGVAIAVLPSDALDPRGRHFKRARALTREGTAFGGAYSLYTRRWVTELEVGRVFVDQMKQEAGAYAVDWPAVDPGQAVG